MIDSRLEQVSINESQIVYRQTYMSSGPLSHEAKRAFAPKSWVRITHTLSFAYFAIEPTNRLEPR